MTKYILTLWSSFTLQWVPSYNGQAILVRKVNIHAYSMYVLLADKVSCPMTHTLTLVIHKLVILRSLV